MKTKFKVGCRVTDGTDCGEVVNQHNQQNIRGYPKRTLVTWDREYEGNKQTGYPLTVDLIRLN